MGRRPGPLKIISAADPADIHDLPREIKTFHKLRLHCLRIDLVRGDPAEGRLRFLKGGRLYRMNVKVPDQAAKGFILVAVALSAALFLSAPGSFVTTSSGGIYASPVNKQSPIL